jgi:hypothetical protein
VDLSSHSDEEEPIHDISRDFEFAQCLFGERNRDLLGLPGDSKVIILSDFDEEKEEAREEKSTGAKDAATSAVVNPVSTASTDDINTLTEKSLTPTASPTDAGEDPEVEPNDSSDGLAPGPKVEEGNGDGDEAGMPVLRKATFSAATLLPFLQRSWDGDAESWLTLMTFMPTSSFCSLLCFGYVLDVALDSK